MGSAIFTSTSVLGRGVEIKKINFYNFFFSRRNYLMRAYLWWCRGVHDYSIIHDVVIIFVLAHTH